MIRMTEKAAERINSLVEGTTHKGLRIKIVGGGCSGLTYKMELGSAQEHDKIFDHAGAQIFVDRKSFLYLANTTLDFKDDLMASGFVFENPQVKRTCGCGNSFTV